MVALSVAAIAPASCHRSVRPPRRTQRGAPSGAEASIRALWVTRWDYKNPGDIAAIMEQCQQAGFNTVLFQVRGNGTVLYPSQFEPWSKEFDGRDPGFDPLAEACKEARRRGLKLHAWVNVIPGWRGDAPPEDRRQLYHAHPDWFWRDAQGRRQPLGWYNSLNPCLPAVRKYLTAVMHEIVSRYPVDGLHMDYIRFPNEWHKMYARLGRVPDYPRDRKTLSLFARDSGGATPDSSPARWNAWRTAQVTQLVRDIRNMMRRTRPQAQLSAAVGAFPAESKRKHFQDAMGWIAEGLLDAVYPMNYSQSMPTFDEALREWAPVASDPRVGRSVASDPRVGRLQVRIPVVVGIMFDERDPRLVNHQVTRAARSTGGFAAFAYSSLFGEKGT